MIKYILTFAAEVIEPCRVQNTLIMYSIARLKPQKVRFRESMGEKVEI
jgi:hypothetical protein